MSTTRTAYLVPEQHHGRASAALQNIEATYGELIVVTGPAQRCDWALDTWLDVEIADVASIGEAAKLLRAVQRNWSPYAFHLHRRSELLREKLPHVGHKALDFPTPPPSAPVGAYAWLSQDKLLYSARRTSCFIHGKPNFVEYKEHQGPVSRAYLKVFEALTIFGSHPVAGQKCLEVGASPGGWTWALAKHGAQVTAIDRSPLDPRISALPNVTEKLGDAFAATPEQIGSIDWLFSDVICYPEKLYEYVKLWLDAGTCPRFVCTLKFQGEGHYQIVDEFLAIAGARIVHLYANKHELTFMLDRSGETTNQAAATV